MITPGVYLDECVDIELASLLRRRNFRVVTVRDAGMLSARDADQLAYAAAQDVAILTHNQRDFQRLHHAHVSANRPHAGIILIPFTVPLDRLAIRAALMLDWVATFPAHRSQMFQWGHLQAQLERGFLIPSYDDADIRFACGR